LLLAKVRKRKYIIPSLKSSCEIEGIERKQEKISQFHAVFQSFVKEMNERRTLLTCFLMGVI